MFLLFSVAFGGVAGATGGRGELMLVSCSRCGGFYRDIGAFGIPVRGTRWICMRAVVGGEGLQYGFGLWMDGWTWLSRAEGGRQIEIQKLST